MLEHPLIGCKFALGFWLFQTIYDVINFSARIQAPFSHGVKINLDNWVTQNKPSSSVSLTKLKSPVNRISSSMLPAAMVTVSRSQT